VDSPISTKAAILAALARDSCYGSDIMDRMKSQTDGALMLHSGSVYPALVALEKEGLIKARPDLNRGSSRACFYELTKKGREAAQGHQSIVATVFFPAGEIFEYFSRTMGAVPTMMGMSYAGG
jgi:PadR family transcriptional regulator PadR